MTSTACRHAEGTISSSDENRMSGVWSLRILEQKLESFLLIVRTRRIFTAACTASSAGFSEFPAYGQMRTAPLPMRGAAIYLRTVIVTAAVYRGLDSKLRPKANLSS
jgi:hypothetical protein